VESVLKTDPEIYWACRRASEERCWNMVNRLILEREFVSTLEDQKESGGRRKSLLICPDGKTRVPRPFPVINVALNLVEGRNLAWQQRKATSFTMTPLHCGFSKGYRSSVEYGGGVGLGTAMTISGAAATPNMGYHSSPAVTFLMTLFNVRLGWWLGNPTVTRKGVFHRIHNALFGRETDPAYRRSDPVHSMYPLVNEAIGRTDDTYPYVYLSDGGHFENLGLYEMVRRRCRYIVVSDASHDPECSFEDLGNAIRKIQIDMGIKIEFEHISFYPKIRKMRGGRYCAVGEIRYADVDGKDVKNGKLIYLKPARHRD
jgi:hypothetical protein